MAYYTYILECRDKTLYTGSTKNIEKRLHQHNNLSNGATYTKLRRPVTLKYYEEFDSLSLSLKREKEIKKLNRKKKLELIANGKSFRQ